VRPNLEQSLEFEAVIDNESRKSDFIIFFTIQSKIKSIACFSVEEGVFIAIPQQIIFRSQVIQSKQNQRIQSFTVHHPLKLLSCRYTEYFALLSFFDRRVTKQLSID
jgi:hypothetical protein